MASMLHRACLVLLMAAPLLASGRALSDAEQDDPQLAVLKLQACSQNVVFDLLQRKSVELGNTSDSGSCTRDAGSRPKVVFIKTHYTGGSTMTGIFQHYCDQHHVNCAPNIPHEDTGGTVTRKELAEYVRSHAGNDTVDIWPWHVVYDNASFAKLIPGAVTFSILRDPIPRFKSYLAHDFIRTPFVNMVLHSLQKNEGEVPSCGHSEHTTMFEQLPRLSELDLVLLTEDYDRSLVLLARKLKWPLQDLLYIRVRKSNPDQHKQELLDKVEAYLSQPLENMTENGKAFIKKCILKDQEIYNEAKEMFQKQLDALSHAEVEKDVARLQSANQALKDCCMEAPNDLYCSLMQEKAIEWHRRTESGQSLPPGVFHDRCRHKAVSALG